MNSRDKQFEPVLVEAFNTLRVTPERNILIAAPPRESFLAEAGRLAQTVSDHRGNRLFNWNTAFLNLWAYPRKEKRPMLNFATSLLLVIGIFLGSGGAAVAAAQSSLPDEALYPIKTWSEEARLQLAHDDETQLQLELQFINRRMVEIRTMLQSGEVPSDAFLNRGEWCLAHPRILLPRRGGMMAAGSALKGLKISAGGNAPGTESTSCEGSLALAGLHWGFGVLHARARDDEAQRSPRAMIFRPLRAGREIVDIYPV